MKILYLLPLLLVGCGGFTNLVNVDHCMDGDVRCIMESVDQVRQEDVPEDEICKPMQGYILPKTQYLYDEGLLEIGEINPVIPVLAVLGAGYISYNVLYFGKYGDIAKTKIRYPSWLFLSNDLLAHELLHSRGICGNGFHSFGIDYTRRQREIMKEEGVSRWQDTTWYKSEEATWHYP